MTRTVIEPAKFSLSLAPLSQKIYAGEVKILSDGKKHWAEATGKKHDVTSDFYYVLLALAGMIDNSTTQGNFTFSDENVVTYEVTIKSTEEETNP